MGVSSPADFSRVDELRQPNAHTERAPRVFGISPAKCRWALSTARRPPYSRSEEHTSELQSRPHLVCRLLLEKKKKKDHIKSDMIVAGLNDIGKGKATRKREAGAAVDTGVVVVEGHMNDDVLCDERGEFGERE